MTELKSIIELFAIEGEVLEIHPLGCQEMPCRSSL